MKLEWHKIRAEPGQYPPELVELVNSSPHWGARSEHRSYVVRFDVPIVERGKPYSATWHEQTGASSSSVHIGYFTSRALAIAACQAEENKPFAAAGGQA